MRGVRGHDSVSVWRIFSWVCGGFPSKESALKAGQLTGQFAIPTLCSRLAEDGKAFPPPPSSRTPRSFLPAWWPLDRLDHLMWYLLEAYVGYTVF